MKRLLLVLLLLALPVQAIATNDYYNKTTTLTAGTIARAAVVETKFSAVESGFDLLPGKIPLLRDTVNFANDTASTDAYIVTLTEVPSSLVDGMAVWFRPATSNTGACTLDANGLGAKAIKRYDTADTITGDILAGRITGVRYNLTNDNWDMVSHVPEFSTSAAASATAAASSANDSANSATTSAASAVTSAGHASTSLGYANLSLGYSNDSQGYSNDSQAWATQLVTTVGGIDFSSKEYATGDDATVGSSKQWATKVDGIIGSSDYSSKAYAIGGTGVTASSGKGAAKEWATTTGATVDTSEYSAKEYAVGSVVTGGSAKEWATTTGATIDGAEYSSKEYAVGNDSSEGSAKEWATITGVAVDGVEYSSKEYAVGNDSVEGSAKEWAVTDQDVVVAGGKYSAYHWAQKAASTSLPIATANYGIIGNGSGTNYEASAIYASTDNTLFGRLAGTNLTSGVDNTIIGYNTGGSITSSSNNVVIGDSADSDSSAAVVIGSGASISGTGGVAIGPTATTASSNTVAIGSAASVSSGAASGGVAIGNLALVEGYKGIAIGQNATVKSNSIAIGYDTLSSTTISSSQNVAIGQSSQAAATTGGTNVSVGGLSLEDNVLGSGNVAVGYSALLNHIGASAVASQNTAVGAFSLNTLTTGNKNVAIGYRAGYSATTALYNTLIGHESGDAIIGGLRNVGVGMGTLAGVTTNDSNTALGYHACLSGNYTNSTCIGYVSAVTGSNQVQLGNSATTTYAYGAVQDRSDSRDKADIVDTSVGLEFLNALRPVDFKWNYREDYVTRTYDNESNLITTVLPNDGSKKRTELHQGLIAQEVKSVMDSQGIEFGGYNERSADQLGLGYTEFIGPLIKAIQELSAQNTALELRIQTLEAK